jgi:hypothetical protein
MLWNWADCFRMYLSDIGCTIMFNGELWYWWILQPYFIIIIIIIIIIQWRCSPYRALASSYEVP